MAYTVAKNITPQKRNTKRHLVDLVFFIVAIPVLVISLISLALYYLPFKVRSLFGSRRSPPFDSYNHELPLVSNEKLSIVMVEDEHDITLTELNEEWMDAVYNEDTYLYRIRTNPTIAGIENRIGGFFFKEEPEGIILQLVKERRQNESLPDTELLFIRHDTLEVFPIESTGPYFLYNDENDHTLIRGFNKKENIEITLRREQMTIDR